MSAGGSSGGGLWTASWWVARAAGDATERLGCRAPSLGAHSRPVRAALPAVLSTHEHPRGAAWLSLGSPLDSQLWADSPGRGRLGGVRQKCSPGSGRRLQAAPSLLGTGLLETPWPESVDCPPAVVGGHSPFHVRHCAIHSKPACNPLANFLSHPRGWPGVRDVALRVEGGMDAPRPSTPSQASLWCMVVGGEGPLCARVPKGRLPLLGPLFQAGAPQPQVAKGWTFWGLP